MADIVFGMGASHSPMLAIKPDQWPLRAEDDKKNPRHFFRGRQFSFDELVSLRKDEGFARQLTLEVMREPESGTIVNVASMNGKVPAPFMSSYVAAKHAVVGFTKSLQQEKKQQQSPLRVSLVCPGWVRTPIMDARDGFEFPSWLGWAVESPRRAALEIIAGIEAGKDEITPTWNGRLIRGAHAVAPGLVESSTRLLTAKSWKEALGLSRIRK